MPRIIITALVGAVLSGGIGYLLLPVLRALKAGQSIREIGPTWHNNKAGTPMMGGLMFIFAAILCLLGNLAASVMESYTVFLVIGLALCFGLVGFLDDFFKIKFKRNLGLTSIQKALLQMAVSAIFLYILYKLNALSTEFFIPFFKIQTPKLHLFAYLFIAMFIMVGCVNAVNLTDGVDGLCATVTLPVMIFFAAIACYKQQYDIAILPAALAGGLVAYLFFNWHPAKVFMGDTGSLFLGGVTCALAFALDIPLVLVLVGFVYIVETMSVILQVGYFKLTKGKRLFKMSPIHHHFEMSGWKEEKICIVFGLVSAVMCVIAWFSVVGF